MAEQCSRPPGSCIVSVISPHQAYRPEADGLSVYSAQDVPLQRQHVRCIAELVADGDEKSRLTALFLHGVYLRFIKADGLFGQYVAPVFQGNHRIGIVRVDRGRDYGEIGPVRGKELLRGTENRDSPADRFLIEGAFCCKRIGDGNQL